MQTFSFKKLEQELAAAGTAPAVIARITHELKDHCADAEAAALARGLSPARARRHAHASLGGSEAIVSAVVAQQSLLDWRHRWPQSAKCVDSLAYCIALPAAPIIYCASHPAWIVRWGLSSSLAVCITASILLGLQWMIV
jgi:hypothetical protein